MVLRVNFFRTAFLLIVLLTIVSMTMGVSRAEEIAFSIYSAGPSTFQNR